ncbi:MAG: hypothetical protein HC844_17200 [Tabrizicola sp.]|nr:hypothetical protein [Tabrizicola sp.]
MVRRTVSLVVVGIVVLAMIAVIVIGPAAVDRVLPGSVLSFLQGIGLRSDVTTIGAAAPKGTGEFPSDYLRDGKNGVEARGPIAARAGNEAVFIKDVISGYTTRVSTDIPAEITTIRPVSGCNFTPPGEGSVVGHAIAKHSGMRLAMATYSDADLAGAVKTFVAAYRKTGLAEDPSTERISYEAYDVAVTETHKPVYLVLQSGGDNLIWNIHLAPGARLERVVLLGGSQAGVANVDPVVPVEVLLAEGMSDCGILPAYPLNEGHLFFQSLAVGAMSREEASGKLALIEVAVSRYDDWFKGQFRVSAIATRAGWDAGTISVVGPVPMGEEPKAVWAKIDGAKIRTTQDTFFEIDGQIAPGTDFVSRVRAVATSFAWGDLDRLRQGVEFR